VVARARRADGRADAVGAEAAVQHVQARERGRLQQVAARRAGRDAAEERLLRRAARERDLEARR
jgi:hypothetical protein